MVPEDARPKFKPVGKIDLDKLNSRKVEKETVKEVEKTEPAPVVKEKKIEVPVVAEEKTVIPELKEEKNVTPAPVEPVKQAEPVVEAKAVVETKTVKEVKKEEPKPELRQSRCNKR